MSDVMADPRCECDFFRLTKLLRCRQCPHRRHAAREASGMALDIPTLHQSDRQVWLGERAHSAMCSMVASKQEAASG